MISATLCAIIFPAPVVQVLPLERRSDRTSVFETGLTRARHQPAIGATKSTRLVGLRRSLARVVVRQNKSRGRWTLPGQFYSTGTELGAFRDVARQLSRDLLGGDLEAAPLGYLQCSHRGIFAGRPFGWGWRKRGFGAGWAGS